MRNARRRECLISNTWAQYVHGYGECGTEVKKRVQAAWRGWERMPGVICKSCNETEGRVEVRPVCSMVTIMMMMVQQYKQFSMRLEHDHTLCREDIHIHGVNSSGIPDASLDPPHFPSSVFLLLCFLSVSEQSLHVHLHTLVTIGPIHIMPLQQFYVRISFQGVRRKRLIIAWCQK